MIIIFLSLLAIMLFLDIIVTLGYKGKYKEIVFFLLALSIGAGLGVLFVSL